jgi:hypothetical protein
MGCDKKTEASWDGFDERKFSRMVLVLVARGELCPIASTAGPLKISQI